MRRLTVLVIGLCLALLIGATVGAAPNQSVTLHGQAIYSLSKHCLTGFVMESLINKLSKYSHFGVA